MLNSYQFPRDHEAFARDFLEDTYGGPLPPMINPLKNFKRLLRSFGPDEMNDVVKSLRKIFFIKNKSESYLDSRIKASVHSWVKRHFSGSIDECFEFCGFTLEELKKDIESKWEPWMTWDNWGEWQVDHKIPRCMYGKPYSREEVYSLKNLRPISRAENRAKGSRLVFC